MSTRREIMNYIGTAAIGGIVGYYARAKGLLGLKSEVVVRQSTEETPIAETPTEEASTEATPTDEAPTEEPPTEAASGNGSRLVTTGFPRFQYDNRNTGFPPDTRGPQNSPTLRWQFDTDGNNHTTPAIHDGTAYFGGGGGSDNQNNSVYAVDVRDGSEIWRFDSDAAFQSCAAVRDAVYIADNGGQLYALDPANGSAEWSLDIGRASYTASPVVTTNRVYIGDPEAGGIVGVDAETGEQVWELDTQGGVPSSPAVTNNTLYYATETGTVRAVDIVDETRLWEFSADGEVTGAPVVHNGDVYVTTDTGAVHTIAADTGDERWTTNMDQPIRSSPAVDDTSLYVGDGELFESPGKLYSLSTDTGAVEWAFQTESSYGGRQGAIIRSPTVGADGVYFGVDANKVYAVTKEDGTELWRFDTSVVLSSPAIHEEVLYTGTDNNEVLALE